MKKVAMILVLFSAFFLQACGFEVVDTGHRGVETRFGKVIPTSLSEGWHWYNPLTSNITELDVRIKKMEMNTKTYTKDVQQADIQVTINYHLDPTQAHVLFQTVGHDWDTKLVPQVVEGTLKAVIGKWDAVDLIGNRDKAQVMAQERIKLNLASKGVILTRLEFSNIDYSDKFERAVEAKQVAIQSAIEEKNRTVQKRELAKQKVIQARASATAIRIRATALKANPSLIRYEAVKKWNGKLPRMMLGGGAIPFIEVNKEVKKVK